MGIGRSITAPFLGLLALTWGASAAAQDDAATFELTLDITWSAETAPFEFPADAHLSRLFGATHHSRYTLFRDGDTASTGVEVMAESGRGTVLAAEWAEAGRRGRVGTVFEGPALSAAPGSVTTTFEATSAHPLVSFVTMLAPSPDWFTGAADVPLWVDGQWIDEVELVLWAWDSGTDNGETYDAANADTQPRHSVRLLATPHFLTATGLVPMGTARLRRIAP